MLSKLAIISNLILAGVFLFGAFACWMTKRYMARDDVRAGIVSKFERYESE